MRNKQIFLGIVFFATFLFSYSQELTVEVSNPTTIQISDYAIELSAQEILEKKPGIKLENCIVLDNNQEIASQVNDIDHDGTIDKLIFLSDFSPSETMTFIIKQTNTPNNTRVYKKRTQAEISHKVGGKFVKKTDGSGRHEYEGGTFKNVDFLKVPHEHTDHSWFIRYEGPGWESDKVGYRFYLDWRNAIDIFGKLTDTMVLQNVGQDGFDNYHNPAPWGMDIFKVGKTLGIGSIALWENEKVHMVSKTDSVSCRIALNGPVQSMVETRYFGWEVNGKKRDLVSQLFINGGSRASMHKISINENDSSLFCTGLIMDPKAEIFGVITNKKWSYFATWGRQSLNNDSLGIAVFYRNENLEKNIDDKLSHIAVLKPIKGELKYYFLAAWEKEPNGIKTKNEFTRHLDEFIEVLNNPVVINIE